MSEKPLISIIVPVYNVEQYIEQCVTSLINQTYEEIEIILVDDGSTDKSGRMCDELLKRDKRIKVIHKENGGLSDARNIGIDNSAGRFISFVDSDDFVEETYINCLYDVIMFHDADIAVGAYYITSFREKKMEVNQEIFEKVYTSEEGILDLLYQKNMTSSAWAKMYKRELFREIRFPLNKLHEDVPVVYNVFLKANKIAYIDKKIYYYFQRKGSIVNSSFRREKLDYISHTKQIVEEMKYREDKFYKAAVSRHISACFQILFQIPFNILFSDIGNFIWNEIKNYRLEIIKDKDVRKINKYACILSVMGRVFPYWIGKVIYGRRI